MASLSSHYDDGRAGTAAPRLEAQSCAVTSAAVDRLPPIQILLHPSNCVMSLGHAAAADMEKQHQEHREYLASFN